MSRTSSGTVPPLRAGTARTFVALFFGIRQSSWASLSGPRRDGCYAFLSSATSTFLARSTTIDGVWQELLDADLVANAADLLEALQDAGGQPPDGPQVLRLLAEEARAVHLGAVAGERLMTRQAPAGAAQKSVTKRLLEWVGLSGGGQRAPGAQGARDQRDGRPSEQQTSGPPPHAPTPRPQEVRSPEYEALLAELNERLREPYVFQVFAADGDDRAIDFGLFVSYRQTWQPQGHQAGALVKTVTLAPREERAFTTRTTYKRTTTAVRATTMETQRRSESQDTTRAAADIVKAAKTSMGFETTASGGFSAEIYSAEGSVTNSLSVERSSQQTRQSMREGVRRAAQEAKESLRTEVTTTESTETFREETGKISNPNDELPVTYLFYELQRRFRVSERVHQMVPVVMVARPVPPPEHITRGWLFTNGWILRHALLDEEFLPALQYLLNEAAGMETKASELKVERDLRRALVEKVQLELLSLSAEAQAAYNKLQRAGVLLDLAHWPTNRGGQDTLKDAYDLAVQREQTARERLAQALAAQDAANQAYVEALATQRDHELAVRRLLVHVKQNILHYMRSIWSSEDRDQRYFELHSVRVPRLAGHLEYQLVHEEPLPPPVPPLWLPPYKIEAHLVPENIDPRDDTVPLGSVADLEHPLGYKGNFMVFPLLRHNVLTKFLALPYLDNRMGACDPELLANFTLSDLQEYLACARETRPPEELERIISAAQELYDALVERPFPDEEDIVVPTDSTFIEALPGTRPVLEDYKLLHRVIDVAKAAAEVRARELENLRLVARIRDGQLSDPEIQTMIVAPEDAGITFDAPSGNTPS